MTNKHIAAELDISPHTVRDHISAMLVKFSVGNRMQLVACFVGTALPMGGPRSQDPLQM